MKRRAFLVGAGVLVASALAPVRWALARARKKIVVPLIARVGQVFSFTVSGATSFPSYAEAY